MSPPVSPSETDLCSPLAARLSFAAVPNGTLRDAFETIRNALLAAPNKQAAESAAHRLAQTFGELTQALKG